MDSKKIWVIYSSRKGGHAYPSKALYDYIENRRNGYKAQLINTLDFSGSLSNADRLGRLGDLKLRSIYRVGYRRLQQNSQLMKGLYRFATSLFYQYSKLSDKLTNRHGKPDIIVSIQPEVNVAARLFKDWFSVPFHTIIIDLAIHGLWINQHIDKYYVANGPLKKDLIDYGVPEYRIIVSGMPLRAGFSNIVGTRVRAVKKRLGLSQDMHTVLLVGGLLGRMLDFPGAIESIMNTQMPMQILAVFGKNDVDRKKAEQLKARYKWPMHIFGTVSNMDDLMWASDLVISKPGSVTMAEALSLSKPMIVINPLAGSAQELRFARFLEENGAGVWIKSVQGLGSVLKSITESRDEYTRMCGQAKRLGECSLTANETIFNDIRQAVEAREDF